MADGALCVAGSTKKCLGISDGFGFSLLKRHSKCGKYFSRLSDEFREIMGPSKDMWCFILYEWKWLGNTPEGHA